MTAHAVADRRLHPGTVFLRLLKGLPQTLLGLPALVTFLAKTPWGYFLLIALASLAVFLLFHFLWWRRFRYGVGLSELVIESGSFSRVLRTIPFDRIQDVDIEQGPLHRLFGLAKVRVETGGQGKDEGALDSVTLAEAGRLRAAIKAGRAGAATVSAEDVPAAAERVVFTMPLPRVLLSGLFRFSLLWLAAIFAALQAVENLLPFDLYDIPHWIGLAEDNLAGRVTVLAVLSVAIVAVMLGYLSGIVSTVARDYGFRLSDEGGGLRRERGLLTRTAVMIAKRRIQLGQVRSGPIRRALGWFDLRVQTLGASEAKKEGGLQEVAPFADSHEMDAVLERTGRLRLPDVPLIRVSSRHLWKAAAKAAAVVLVPVIVASWFEPRLLAALLLAPVAVVAALIERRFHRYALDRGILFIQTGFWRRRLWLVPVDRIQTVSLTRGLLQRFLDLSTLHFDTAGASAMGGPAIADLRADTAARLFDTILERKPAADV